jgi:hypothetical protein
MDKYASEVIRNGFEYGMQLYGIRKAAAMGDQNAQRWLYNQAKAAQEGMDPAMMDPNAMGGAPAPTIPCPKCQQNVTPTPEGICPACGFDFNTLAAQAAQEAVSNTADEYKEAAVRYPQVMHQLMTHYGRR